MRWMRMVKFSTPLNASRLKSNGIFSLKRTESERVEKLPPIYNVIVDQIKGAFLALVENCEGIIIPIHIGDVKIRNRGLKAAGSTVLTPNVIVANILSLQCAATIGTINDIPNMLRFRLLRFFSAETKVYPVLIICTKR